MMRRTLISSIEQEYRRYESLGDGALAQLADEDLAKRVATWDNSIATIVWHVAGNLESRFTDFLTSDGEKPWRNRESEFEARSVSRGELQAKWERGWKILFDAVAPLTDDDLTRMVAIRGQPLPVHEALHRSLAHAAYHVGQIVYQGKTLRGAEWSFLTIPPGGSQEYNRNPTMEKGRAR
jgi:hypothetical protein